MKLTNPLLTKAAGLFGASLIRGWTATLDYRIVYQDPAVDPVHPRCRPGALYVLWHEYLVCPLGVRGRKMTVLISQHRDGELITRVLRHLGFHVVRGSSTRGGIAALRQILRNQDKSVVRRLRLIITPDGPRGPRRQLEKGAVFLASRLEIPIICMGFAFDRPWRLGSWDRFAVPRPFSRARAVISPFLEIPSFLDPDSLERHRVRVEQVLNQVTEEAEQWAESGHRKVGELPMLLNKFSSARPYQP